MSRRSFNLLGINVPMVAVAGTIVVVVVVGLAIVPVRTWMNQRDEAELLTSELQQVETQNEELRRMQEQLETPAEVERRAREDYGYVYPGEEQFVVEDAEAP